MRYVLAVLVFSVLSSITPAWSAPRLKTDKAEAVVRRFLELFLEDKIESAVKLYVNLDESIERAFGEDVERYPTIVREEARRLLRMGVVRIFRDILPFWREHGIRVIGAQSQIPKQDGAIVYAQMRRSDGIEDQVPFQVVAPGRIVCVGTGPQGLMPDLAYEYKKDAALATSKKTTPFRVLMRLASPSRVRLAKGMLVASKKAQTEWASPDALTLPIIVPRAPGAPADERASADTTRVVVHIPYGGAVWLRAEGGRGAYERRAAYDGDHLRETVRKHLAGQGTAGKRTLLIRADRDARWRYVAALTSLMEDESLGLTSVAVGVERTGAGQGERWGRLPMQATTVANPHVDAILQGVEEEDRSGMRYKLTVGAKSIALPFFKFDDLVPGASTYADFARRVTALKDDLRASLGAPSERRGARLRFKRGDTARVGYVLPLILMLRELGGGPVELVGR